MLSLGCLSMERVLIFQLKKLLVLYNATTYKRSKMKDRIKEYETAFLGIPSGLTWKLK